MTRRPRRHTETERSERDRRRRLSDAFADVLPEGTSDESGEGWAEGPAGSTRADRDESWYRSQVPPHHG